MKRQALVLAVALAAGCARESVPEIAEGREHIACALGGKGEFAPKCAVERGRTAGQLQLVVRHPDGSFRRFLVTDDGRDLQVADGAHQAELELAGKEMVVRVDGDSYRFVLPLTDDAAS